MDKLEIKTLLEEQIEFCAMYIRTILGEGDQSPTGLEEQQKKEISQMRARMDAFSDVIRMIDQ